MTPRLFISRDAGALALGAEDVERAIIAAERSRGLKIEIVRTGSRGLFWLEPMIEVATPAGRIAYGPIRAADVEALFDAGFLDGGAHDLRLGRPEDIPFLKRQNRRVFARSGMIDRLSVRDYQAHDGFRGIEKAIAVGPAAIVDAIGRAGVFGIATPHPPTVCTVNERGSGTFADRMLVEGDPFALIEGMTIAGIATGATKGIVHFRPEFRHAREILRRAIEIARSGNVLGTKILGSIYDFDLEFRVGPPAPRNRADPTTSIADAISFATVALILADNRDPGMAIQLSGNLKYRGLFETASCLTLGELIDGIGGGTANGRPLRVVQVGGPAGPYWPRALFDREILAPQHGSIRQTSIVAFDDTVDMARQARFAMAFGARECSDTCRAHAARGVEMIDRIIHGDRPVENAAALTDLCAVMRSDSVCTCGDFISNPVTSALNHFPEDFGIAPGDVMPLVTEQPT